MLFISEYVGLMLIIQLMYSLRSTKEIHCNPNFERGVPVTSSRTTILHFTIHETNIYVFTISLKIRGLIKCQKRYVSTIL